MLLPELDQAPLYHQFDFGKDWRDPANLQPAATQVAVFLCPSAGNVVPQDGGFPLAATDYAFCKGPAAFLCPVGFKTGMFDVNSRMNDTSVGDGLSQTIAMGEAVSGVLIQANSSGMTVGQVGSKADFDGTDGAGFQGGRGSVLAVTAQNAGPDRMFGTADDLLMPLNADPAQVSIDNQVGNGCNDPLDRVRGFSSLHVGGAFFLFGDGSVQFLGDSVDMLVYIALSTARGKEAIGAF